MSAAIDSGNPLVIDSPKSRLARSYHEFAAALTEAATESAIPNNTPHAGTSSRNG
jgi:hypothetical protein